MISGYAGRILHVDLTTGRVEFQPLDTEMARKFIGGFGISSRILYDAVRPETDPLSPGNVLIISAGALSGTVLPGANKTDWSSKSPLTHLAQFASSSGLGAHLKWAGYDAVVFTGKADRPSYVTICDDEVRIKDAGNLWGKDTYQTTDNLWNKYGNQCAIACVGPAGEKLARISMAYVDKISTLGREGSGAVFGSKNLKAIVINGTKGIKAADPEGLLARADKLYERYLRDPFLQKWMDLGTTIALEEYGRIGNLLWKNWRESYPCDRVIARFGVQAFLKVKDISIPCTGCPLGCKILYKIKEGDFSELETPQSCNVGAVMSYGSRFDLESYNQVVKCHDTANRYGLDSIEVSSVLDFLIDLQEQGIITKDVTDGLILKRDMNTVLLWTERIANRKGFGNILADGYPGLFKALGNEVKKYAVQRRGSSPDFDVRGVFGLEGLGIAVGIKGPHSQLSLGPTVLSGRKLEDLRKYTQNIGLTEDIIDHIFSDPSGFNIAAFCRYVEAWNSVLNMMGICNRPPIARLYSLPLLSELYCAMTGSALDTRELIAAGDRTVTLLKLFNLREGAVRGDDSLPERYFNEPLLLLGKEAWLMDYYRTRRIFKDDFGQILNDYYKERGWDEKTGIPCKETMLSLGLDEK